MLIWNSLIVWFLGPVIFFKPNQPVNLKVEGWTHVFPVESGLKTWGSKSKVYFWGVGSQPKILLRTSFHPTFTSDNVRLVRKLMKYMVTNGNDPFLLGQWLLVLGSAKLQFYNLRNLHSWQNILVKMPCFKKKNAASNSNPLTNTTGPV